MAFTVFCLNMFSTYILLKHGTLFWGVICRVQFLWPFLPSLVLKTKDTQLTQNTFTGTDYLFVNHVTYGINVSYISDLKRNIADKLKEGITKEICKLST